MPLQTSVTNTGKDGKTVLQVTYNVTADQVHHVSNSRPAGHTQPSVQFYLAPYAAQQLLYRATCSHSCINLGQINQVSDVYNKNFKSKLALVEQSLAGKVCLARGKGRILRKAKVKAQQR